jgi:hypothetical protein
LGGLRSIKWIGSLGGKLGDKPGTALSGKALPECHDTDNFFAECASALVKYAFADTSSMKSTIENWGNHSCRIELSSQKPRQRPPAAYISAAGADSISKCIARLEKDEPVCMQRSSPFGRRDSFFCSPRRRSALDGDDGSTDVPRSKGLKAALDGPSRRGEAAAVAITPGHGLQYNIRSRLQWRHPF